MELLVDKHKGNDEHCFWSKDVNGISYNQLQKFWSQLSAKDKQELLKIDKQALMEQARKNMCCSRCNGLLLESFLQIVSHGRLLQQRGVIVSSVECNNNRCTCEFEDPYDHQWGGLTTTKDGLLTVLDCFLYAKSFKGLQIVFECARARESERESFPDACGGGSRVWISQGMIGYGKGHGTREACALHTARLTCDTLLDFWSTLDEESRLSLLRMKEDDFMERLTYRFDYKKFCRDCRRNVVREFKELRELKRLQITPRCTEWFCVADTAFQYEVGIDSVRADWSQYFTEKAGYHQFEWAIGTREGESDILEFKYVGSDRSAQVKGLDLCGFHECYITLRAFKKNGRSSLISVKAHAMRGQQCVHSRLVVKDGFVSIKRGECIRMFLEHAEEIEEEEDEVMIDKDGNELDDECLRPQKHAKSPELAREFLLDAAMVIFKEQVEKACRDRTARENAHNIFVCLSSKLLEQRVHIACKEIITLEKQKKLLEEEEKEKLEEEERKERKRTKEREKKLRRKERLKEKERKNPQFSDKAMLPNTEKEVVEDSLNLEEETKNTVSCLVSGNEVGDGSPDEQDGECLDGYTSPREEPHYYDNTDRAIIDHEEENGYDNPRLHQTARYWKEIQPDHNSRWSDKHSASSRYDDRSHFNGSNKNLRVKASKAGGSPNSLSERYDYHSCKPVYVYRKKVDSNLSTTRSTVSESDYDIDVSKPVNRASNRYTQSDCKQECRPISKVTTISQNPLTMDTVNGLKVSSVRCSPVKAEEIEKKMEVDVKPRNDDDQYTKDHMMTRTSSSDNCSSCLSEGDTSTASSINGNTESSSTSDSEDASQQSEIREVVVTNQKDISVCHEKTTENKGIDETDVSMIKNMLNLPADNVESKLSSGIPFTVPSQNMENMVPNVATAPYLYQPQSMMFPPMPLPVFQDPSAMGYYHHQATVPWPANGLMPYPQPNQYVYTGPLGYEESPLYMQYGTPMNHSAAAIPFLSPGPVPVYHHPFVETKTMSFVDQTHHTLVPLEQTSLKEAPGSVAPKTYSDENFSLFHFSGPVAALSTEVKLKPAPHSKAERTIGEEYNLFATSSSLFSIF